MSGALARLSDFPKMNAEVVRVLADNEIEVRFRFSKETWIWRRAPGHRGADAYYEEHRRISP